MARRGTGAAARRRSRPASCCRPTSLPQLFYYFKGVDIWWKRQISPAPAAARFTDVPLGAAFFAEVEALAASGITVGCTATEFCPEAPLTRRQMAAFLARALGLYYQY